MIKLLSTGIIVVLCCSNSIAQGHPLDSSKAYWFPATPKTVYFNTGLANGFPKTQQQLMYANMAAVMEIVHQQPVLNPPRGFSVAVGATICAEGCAHSGVISAQSGLLCHAWRRKGTKTERDAEGPGMNFFFNDIYRIFGHHTANERTFYPTPTLMDPFKGFPVYNNKVVLTKINKPLFVPVTNERWFQETILQKKEALDGVQKEYNKGSMYQQWLKDKDANTNAFLDGLKYLAQTDPAKAKREKEKFLKDLKVQDSTMKANEQASHGGLLKMITQYKTEIAALETKFNAMNATERKAPSPEAKNMVVPNPDFFNKKLASSDLQLIVIDYNEGTMSQVKDVYGPLFAAIKETMDLKKIFSRLVL